MGKSGFHVDTPAHYLEHSIPSSNSMKDGIEVCAGIGALGEGMTANGSKFMLPTTSENPLLHSCDSRVLKLLSLET